MIVDWFSDPADDTPVLYLRTRGSDGVLKERYLYSGDEGYVTPFCWVRQSAPQWVLNRLRNLNAVVHRNVTAKGVDGHNLWKVTVRTPGALWEIREKCEKWTYEADVQYHDQVLLSMYPGVDDFPEFHPRKWYFDMEWNTTGACEITVIAVVDSDHEHPVVFAWSEESKRGSITKTEWIDRYDGYELRTFISEQMMLDGFMGFLRERDPDMLIAHAGHWADLPKLYDRLHTPQDMSPLGVFYPPKDGSGYQNVNGSPTTQPIKGRLCFDTAAPWTSGSGFEGVWQKSGRGQAESRKLDWFAKELGFEGKLTNAIEGMTVFNGWTDYYDDFVDYCLVDTTLLRDCDEKLHCTDFHLALQRVAGVEFASTHNVSRYFRGLVARRTELKALSTWKENRPELEAAWVMPPVPGRHEGVALVDFASLYPNIILSANLCWTTLRETPDENTLTLNIPAKVDGKGQVIPGTGGVFHWDQSKEGIFPMVVRELLDLRKAYKSKMKAATDPDERLGYDMLQMAVKVSVNACYGMTALSMLQGGWVSYPIAQSITYLGRKSISMLVEESEEQGFRGLAGHTDSCYIQVPFDKAEWLSEHLTKVAQDDLGMKYLDVELEAYFPYWFTANKKNRNFGVKSWPENEAGKMKVTGYALKASNTPKFSKAILGEAFQMIATGAEEEDVYQAIRPLIKETYDGAHSLSDVASSGRIIKYLHNYESGSVPNPARAAIYANTQHKTNYLKGDSVKWVYVDGVPDGWPQTPVAACQDQEGEPLDMTGYDVAWGTIVEKWVTKKMESVYEVLGWDLQSLTARRVPAKLW